MTPLTVAQVLLFKNHTLYVKTKNESEILFKIKLQGSEFIIFFYFQHGGHRKRRILADHVYFELMIGKIMNPLLPALLSPSAILTLA